MTREWREQESPGHPCEIETALELPSSFGLYRPAAAPQAQIRQCHHGKAETKLSRDFIERKGRKGSRKSRKENPSPRSSAPTSATSALKTRTQPHPHEIASRRIGVRRSCGYGSGRG